MSLQEAKKILKARYTPDSPLRKQEISSTPFSVTVTVTVATVTETRRPTTGALPRRLRHAARIRGALATRTHDLSRRSPSRPSRGHAHTHTPHSASQTKHTSYPQPSSNPIQLQLPSRIRAVAALYRTPIHPRAQTPRQDATPPAPHQQLPPRPLGDPPLAARAERRTAQGLPVCRVEQARQITR